MRRRAALIGLLAPLLSAAACQPGPGAPQGDVPEPATVPTAPDGPASGSELPSPSHGDATVHQHTNHLAGESSPYLLQHAHNPVDWYPWGAEAFEKARTEDKPIFLSIGYSTCHWCHVMERESFENEEVAEILNAHFVAIKVDREERPDIDAIYMKAVQALSGGGGGWPLSAWLTHDGKPFLGGTYFPPEDRFGRRGFKTVLGMVHDWWTGDRAKLLDQAEQLTHAVQQGNATRGGGELTAATLAQAAKMFIDAFDPQWGGFNNGRPPKFPRSFALSFLLGQRRHGGPSERLLEIVETTLERMRLGGLHDHLGGGFHRYSTDREWLLPHFEKMLYDQAFLARTYLEAWKVTGKARYERTARDVFTYVLRDLQDDAGGFHSAEDADSEGVEGKFYVWSRAELLERLGQEDGALFADVYQVREEGNFHEEAGGGATGHNILHLQKDLADVAADKGLDVDDLRARMAALRGKLLAVRSRRVRPSLDDKVLTDWNGMMIGALAYGGAALDEPRYVAAARRAAAFLLDTMRPKQGVLLHRYRAGNAGIHGFLDDYAFLALGLVELYQATFEERWLRAANELATEMVAQFKDAEGGFRLAAAHGEQLVAHTKELYDGAIPSGNSAAALALLRVGRLTQDEALLAEGRAALEAWSGTLVRAPIAYPYSMLALDEVVGPAREIVVAAAADDPQGAAMLREIRRRLLPGALVVLHPPGTDGAAIRELVPFVAQQGQKDGRATAYVCTGYACKAPVTSAAELAKLLDD